MQLFRTRMSRLRMKVQNEPLRRHSTRPIYIYIYNIQWIGLHDDHYYLNVYLMYITL